MSFKNDEVNVMYFLPWQHFKSQGKKIIYLRVAGHDEVECAQSTFIIHSYENGLMEPSILRILIF